MVHYNKIFEAMSKGSNMSDRAYAEAQAQQKTLIGSSPKSSLLQRTCACGQHTLAGGECETCRKKREGMLQRAAIGSPPMGEAPPIVQEVLRSPGQPLDTATRAFMEPRFGHDFSRVRVHTNERAAESARAVSARAYTVGRNVVFGAEQYASATTNGQRLLAHELTHVVQQAQSGGTTTTQARLEMTGPRDTAEQEADRVAGRVVAGERAWVDHQDGAHLQQVHPGMIQRTPAPPTYSGVTGNRDLSKIRIEPVADFLANGLTAPLTVNVYITDPTVKHISWLLYDPNDMMMFGSYSTLPGFPDSTTRPFNLEPSHFSRAGFVGGKYLLRCVGLNASHQPVVYADRDFNVMRTDLNTRTALPTTYGDLTFTKYSKTDANPPATPRYTVDVELQFLPKAAVPCNDVTFIQSLESVDNQGRSQHHFSSAEKAARQTSLAWSVDQLAGVPSPYYIVGLDQRGRAADIPGYGLAGGGGATPSKATLSDKPSWSQATIDHFESCVICRSGANRGQVYGCATWGFRTDAVGKVTLMPRTFRQMPSDQFEEARVAWNTWRTTIAAGNRPDEAPALRSP
jgi:Domain of unknown function (DUF4157)